MRSKKPAALSLSTKTSKEVPSRLTQGLETLLVHLEKGQSVAEDDLASLAEPRVPNHHQMPSGAVEYSNRETTKRKNKIQSNEQDRGASWCGGCFFIVYILCLTS